MMTDMRNVGRMVFPALVALTVLRAQAPLPPLPAPQAVPKPGPVTDAPYAPQAILPEAWW